MGSVGEQIDLSLPDGGLKPEPKPAPQSPVVALMSALNFAARVINARLLSLLALLGACALFGVAVALPDTTRTVCAALYAVLVLCPVLYLQRKGG